MLSNVKVCKATSGGTVILDDFVKDKANQLWKKGEPDADGFFNLENSEVPKVITAISNNGPNTAITNTGLRIEGNKSLR